MRLAILFSLCTTFTYAQSIETIIQEGHELAVVGVAVSSDSNYVATASKDKSVKLWEISSGREVRSFLGHEATVTSLVFTADGKYLLSGGNDKNIKAWEVESGKQIFSLASENVITSLVITPNNQFFIAAGYSNSGNGDSATVYNWLNQKIIKRISINADRGLGSGSDLSISNDGKWLAIGEDNRVANVYETTDWKLMHTFSQEEGWCGGCGTRVLFSSDNQFLYMASHNGAVKKYALRDNKLLDIYDEKVDDLKGFALSKDGKHLAYSTEKNIIVMDEANGKKLASYAAQEKGDFNEIAFTLDNKKLLISSDDNTAFLWDWQTQQTTKIFTGFLNKRDRGGLNYDPNFYWQSNIARFIRFKNELLLSTDGKTLFKGKFGTKIKQWDVASGKTIMEFSSHQKAALCYALSRDGKKMISGGGDGKIVLWEVSSGDTLQVIQAFREPVFDITFNSDETKVLASSWDATVRQFDLATKKMEHYIDFGNSSAFAIANHPNDLYIFVGKLDNSVQMIELDTKKVVREFVGHTDIISSLTLSVDKNTLLTTSWDGTARLWDVGTGLMKAKLRHKEGAVHTSIFNQNTTLVYAAGADRVISIWDANSSKLIKKLEGHKAEITSLLLSPEGKTLISHSVDGVTKFWDLNTQQEFFEHIHLGENDWMVKNPDGYFHGTDQARQYIHFVQGKKTFSVDQFFQDFYRPDLLPTIFKNRGEDRDLKDVQGKLKTSPPPLVKIAAFASEENKANVFIRVSDGGGGIQSLRLYHNGKLIDLPKEKLQALVGKNQTIHLQQSVNLIGGSNVFTATASNRQNIESDPQQATLFSEQQVKNSTCYVLAIGINEYKNPKLTLNYAKPDASSFSALINAETNTLYKKIELITLYDAAASKQNILKTIDDLASRVQTEDVFILYYAGHGSMVDNKFYFIPNESARLYDASALQKEAIDAAILQERLKMIKALKQVIIMDACQSGGSVELLATRGASEEKAIAQLSRASGIHVLASAGSEQFATEFAELGHGLFTYVLIRALQGEADGAPKDGKVTIYELKSFLDDQVPEMTRKLKGRPQYPYTFSRGQDFPILIKD